MCRTCHSNVPSLPPSRAIPIGDHTFPPCRSMGSWGFRTHHSRQHWTERFHTSGSVSPLLVARLRCRASNKKTNKAWPLTGYYFSVSFRWLSFGSRRSTFDVLRIFRFFPALDDVERGPLTASPAFSRREHHFAPHVTHASARSTFVSWSLASRAVSIGDF